MKRIYILMIVFSMFLGIGKIRIFYNIKGNDNIILSQMSDQDCLKFILENGVELPSYLENENNIASFVKKIIINVEQNPNYFITYNHTELYSFVERIKNLVNDYYGVYTEVQRSYDNSDRISQLVDNYVQKDDIWVSSNGDWNPKWLNYNCYAYAINRIEQPKFYGNSNLIAYNPGELSGNETLDLSNGISTLLDYVEKDLLAIGYSNINIGNYIPNSIGINTELICVRLSLDGYDYHFMRFDTKTNAWYHKPGNTAVLKYKYTPTNGRTWSDEISTPSGEFFPQEKSYTGDIYFISYDINSINLNSNAYSNLAIKNINKAQDTIYKINVNSSLSYEFKLTANYALEINMYDNEMDLLSINKLYYNNGKTIGFKKLLNVGVYYLRINYQNKYQYGDVNIGLGHIHSKLFASYKDQISHEITCSCREKYSERHYVDYDDANDGDNKALCLGCNRLLDLNYDMPEYLTNQMTDEIKYSVNGSYILPNGIAVIVAIDLDKYLNGLLEFNYCEYFTPILEV